MAEKLRIYTFPDSVLKKKAETVRNINGELQRLIENMGETMYDAPGIGLAANQVGVLRRVLVYDLSRGVRAGSSLRSSTRRSWRPRERSFTTRPV